MSDGPGERRPPEPGLKAPEESFDAAAGTVPDEAAGSSSDEAFEPESEAQARVEREAVSLTRRLRQPRTILSIAVPAAIIAFFVWKNGAEFGKVPGIIAHANVLLLVAAFLMYYAGFPIRGYRWARLLRGTGFAIRTRDATEIIFLSWLVNCVVPAKLGDVYRAWLLKMNSEASLSRTFGTVFIERILDLFAIAILGLAAGFWSFRNGLPPAIQIVAVLGVVVVVALAVLLMTMRNFGRTIIVRLPLPVRFIELYDRFEHGVFGAVGLRDLPPLAGLTVLVWVTESLRLYLVVRALGLPGVDLGLSGSVFVALIGSLLTAVPLTPAGLGVVDGGMIFVLTTAYGISIESAGAIVLLDRAISVFTIIILGALAYVVSAKPRGEGRINGTPAPALRVAPGRPGGGR